MPLIARLSIILAQQSSDFKDRIAQIAAFAKVFKEHAPLIIKTGMREQRKAFLGDEPRNQCDFRISRMGSNKR